MKNPSYLKNRIMMNRVLTNKALANKALLHKVLCGMVLGSVLLFASADAKAAGSVPGYVGLNLDPALGDLKGVKYTQEELLSVSREAHAFQGQSGLFAGDGASAGHVSYRSLRSRKASMRISRLHTWTSMSTCGACPVRTVRFWGRSITEP